MSITPPCFATFYDDGFDGSWLDAILHSPCLKVIDYAPDGHSNSDRFAGPRVPFHLSGDTQNEGDNHA